MARMELGAACTDDRQNVYLELRMDGTPLGHMFLAAADVENHIQAIATERAKLADQVSLDLDPLSRFVTVENAIGKVAKHHSREGSGVPLLLRHPGIGWLCFLLPTETAQKLGQHLLQASSPPPSPKGTSSEAS